MEGHKQIWKEEIQNLFTSKEVVRMNTKKNNKSNFYCGEASDIYCSTLRLKVESYQKRLSGDVIMDMDTQVCAFGHWCIKLYV